MQEFLNNFTETFTNPQKRVYWGYLASGFTLGFLYLAMIKRDSISSALKQCFSPEIWFSRSARADYLVFLINKFSFLLLAPVMLTQLTVAHFLFQQLYEIVGYRPMYGQHWPDWAIPLLFTLFYFLLDDFFRYYLHKLLHEIPALWAFHKVHHSARTMTPITVFRAHPVEGLLFSLRTVCVQAISISVFVFFFGNKADLMTVMGASIFAFLFNLTGSNLRHSHVPLRYWPAVEKWLISPAMHQIHHSTRPAHFDKNYGVVIALWDRIGGTLVHGNEAQDIHYGQSKTVKADEHSLITLYLVPFKESATAIIRFIKSSFPLIKKSSSAKINSDL